MPSTSSDAETAPTRAPEQTPSLGPHGGLLPTQCGGSRGSFYAVVCSWRLPSCARSSATFALALQLLLCAWRGFCTKGLPLEQSAAGHRTLPKLKEGCGDALPHSRTPLKRTPRKATPAPMQMILGLTCVDFWRERRTSASPQLPGGAATRFRAGRLPGSLCRSTS